jgi:hypothetical protein
LELLQDELRGAALAVIVDNTTAIAQLINSVSDMQGLEVSFPRPEDIADKVPKWKYAVCMDFAWFFFGQFPTETGQWFALKKGNRFFRLTTVATGARQPPLLAQLLTLAKRAF